MESDILKAAEEVLAQEGLDSASMHTIAQRAGVSVGTLYNYFEDKDRLLRSLLATKQGEIFSLLQSELETHSSLTFIERLRGYVFVMLKYFDNERNYLRVALEMDRFALRFSMGDTSNIAKENRSTVMSFWDQITPLMIQGVQEGALGKEDLEFYPALLMGGIRGTLIYHLPLLDTKFSDSTERLIRYFLHGVQVK